MIICLTGPMASGKNYIASKMESEGWISKDADKDVHIAIEMAKNDILNAFKDEADKKNINILNSDGTLNRRELGKLLFSDEKLLHQQEQIVYPYVIKLTKEFIENNKGKNLILNATLLFNTPELLELCDKIYYVKSSLLKRIIRAKKRDKLPFFQILKRFYSQKDLLRKYKKTGKEIVIIDN